VLANTTVQSCATAALVHVPHFYLLYLINAPNNSPLIFHFCFVAPPSVLVLGIYFFREMKTREKEFFEEVLFIDVIVGLAVVFMYFWSFLSESLLGATAVKRTVLFNILYVIGASVYRLYSTYALADNDGREAKNEPLYVLYTLVSDSAIIFVHV
jgi:hypothetical protein